MQFIFKYGIVWKVDKGKVKVFFDEDENCPSDWLPVIVRKSKTDKDSWPLEVNEHVCCIMDSHLNTGVVIGAIYNNEDLPDNEEGPGKFRKIFSDGTVFEYDKGAHKLTVDVKGTLDAKATVKAIVTAPDVEITGSVKITGPVQILGTLSAGAISTVPGAGGGSGNMDIVGTINLTGDMAATGDISAGGKSLKTHIHSGVQTGPGNSGPPV
jgi:phage baseplate assembly protein V